ncbi:MAG: vWA domain-containing protein [Actinomycetota bacterium]
MSTETTRAPGDLPVALLRFVHRLRTAGIPVSMVETLDAVDAVRHVDLGDREQFRGALRSTLIKRVEHRDTFDSLFDIYFAILRDEAPPDGLTTSLDRPGAEEAAGPVSIESATEMVDEEDEPSTELLALLLQALRSGDEGALRALAGLAVERFAGLTSDRPSSERYYLYRVLRQLELSELLRQAINQEREEAGHPGALADRLMRDEQTGRIEEFRRMIAGEIRRRLSELKGAQETADVFHDRPIEDVDFLSASPTELREMRAAIRPLAQKLASRIARRRRFRRHGRLDVRRTMRRSLQTGGVPMEPAFRYPRASKPDLYLLCDISGSVSEFARFTMSLLYAMKEEFSRIRLFVFVDGIDEVTDIMEEGSHELAPRNLLYRTKAIAADGHSDYGNVFERFWHLWGTGDLDPRATVIITGDARNNYRDPGLDAFRQIQERSRNVYWLNPEPRSDWDTTDSIMGTFELRCDGVFEARNLRQLAEFVYAIA